ncbi:hypothetical protein MMPV_001578 [Pyropia vietnamensis]
MAREWLLGEAWGQAGRRSSPPMTALGVRAAALFSINIFSADVLIDDDNVQFKYNSLSVPICSVNGITLGFLHNWVQYHFPRGAAWASPNLRPPPLARFAHDEETGELMTCAIRPDGNTYVSTMRCLPNGSKENFSALFAPPCPGDTLPRMVDRSASMEFPFSPSVRGSGGEGNPLSRNTISRTRVTDFAGFPQSFSRYTGTLGGAIGSYVTHPPGESGGGHPFVVLSSVTSAASVLFRNGGGGGADGSMSAMATDAAPYVRAAFAALVGGYGPPLVSAQAEMPGLSGTAVAAGVSFRLLHGARGEEEVVSASAEDRQKTSLSIREEQEELRSPKFRRIRNRDPATRDSPAWAKVVRNRESARRSNERRRQERARAAAAAAAPPPTRVADLVDAAGGVGGDARIAGGVAPTDTMSPRTAGHAGMEDLLLQVAGTYDGAVPGSGEAVATPPSAADWQLWAGGLPGPGWSGAPTPPVGSLLSLDSAVSIE